MWSWLFGKKESRSDEQDGEVHRSDTSHSDNKPVVLKPADPKTAVDHDEAPKEGKVKEKKYRRSKRERYVESDCEESTTSEDEDTCTARRPKKIHCPKVYYDQRYSGTHDDQYRDAGYPAYTQGENPSYHRPGRGHHGWLQYYTGRGQNRGRARGWGTYGNYQQGRGSWW